LIYGAHVENALTDTSRYDIEIVFIRRQHGAIMRRAQDSLKRRHGPKGTKMTKNASGGGAQGSAKPVKADIVTLRHSRY